MRAIIDEVKDRRSLRDFVNLPFKLHKNSPFFVADLRKNIIHLLDREKHPFWQNAKGQLFTARANGVTIGRIAAIIDFAYNEYSGQNCGAFGFFECINNKNVAAELLNAAAQWLKKNEMTFMRGPLNPSTNYTCGMMVSGFHTRPALMMPWNPSYYPALLESWNMRKEQDLFAYVIDKRNSNIPVWLLEETKRLKNQRMFTFRPSSKKNLADDVRAMLELYRASWADNWGFSPLSANEAKLLVKELTAILDPRFFVIFFHENRPCAGMVALPDLNPLLQRLNGKMGLLAPMRFLQSRKEIAKGYRIMLFGVLPEYRRLGLPLLLLDYMLETARKMPLMEWVEGSWVLEDNAAIDDLIEDFGGKIARRYRIYRKELAGC